jgi:hypothetical protein
MLVGNAMILTLFKGRWAGRKPIGVFIVAESCGNKITTRRVAPVVDSTVRTTLRLKLREVFGSLYQTSSSIPPYIHEVNQRCR